MRVRARLQPPACRLSSRGISFTFDDRIADEFCRRNHLLFIVRGHQISNDASFGLQTSANTRRSRSQREFWRLDASPRLQVHVERPRAHAFHRFRLSRLECEQSIERRTDRKSAILQSTGATLTVAPNVSARLQAVAAVAFAAATLVYALSAGLGETTAQIATSKRRARAGERRAQNCALVGGGAL